MLLGYNTNGLAHHDLLEAIELLGDIGYRSVAITLDHASLNPYHPGLDEQLAQVAQALERHQLRSVIETGARYLLDPRRKHEPTLVTADPEARKRRIDFLQRASEIAHRLGSDCISIWSGVLHEPGDDQLVMQRLIDGLRQVLDDASDRDVVVAFEPEPGMYIDTMRSFERLQTQLDDPRLRLTLDIGHLHCLGEVPIPAYIERWGAQLANVHLEDMRAGTHEHLMFGEGELDFPPILAALHRVGYQGGVHVELSRHSHEGPLAAQRAYDFLTAIWIEKDERMRR